MYDILLLLQTIDRATACSQVLLDDPNVKSKGLVGATSQQST